MHGRKSEHFSFAVLQFAQAAVTLVLFAIRLALLIALENGSSSILALNMFCGQTITYLSQISKVACSLGVLVLLLLMNINWSSF